MKNTGSKIVMYKNYLIVTENLSSLVKVHNNDLNTKEEVTYSIG